MRERVPLLAGLTLLSAAVLLGSLALAAGIRDRNRNDVLTVTGSAKKTITSDYAIWDFSVSSQQASAADAAKQLAAWAARIHAFLDKQGIAASELTVQPISTETISGQYTGKESATVTAYRLTRNFEVRSARVAAVAGVAEQSSQLLTEGVPLAAQPLQYIYTKLPSLRPQLLAAATKDAQGRARVLVEATGAHLGKLRGVNVGPFQVTSPNSTAVADYGIYDTSTLRKEVTAVVNVTFALAG